VTAVGERERPTVEQRVRGEARERRYLRGPQSRLFELVHAFGIFREYFHGLRTLHFVGPCVTVFGSARLGEDDPAYALARETGALLAREGFTVMTGGGPGLMEAANRGAREAGGRSVGCNIELPREQQLNRYVDTGVSFRHFFIRKVMLVKYAYGFIALAGGYGTFDELFECLTLLQTGKIRHFPVVLIGHDFWDPVVEVLRRELLGRGTIAATDVDSLLVTDSPMEAVAHVVEVATGLGFSRPERRRRRWLGE
jgi:uncharacterized protein (TIGR00730 family)